MDGFLVRACDLCAKARGAQEPVWLMSPDTWQVCLRHKRWTDNSRSDDPAVLSLKELPQVVRAHEERLRLRRRFGAAGEGLFADAYQVAVHWWTGSQGTPRWVERALAVGLGGNDVRSAPLVIYPEAVFLARVMVRHQRELASYDSTRPMLQTMDVTMQLWGMDWVLGRTPLVEWVNRHEPPPPRIPSGSRRPVMVLGEKHRLSGQMTGSLADRSCLPWQLGMTSAELWAGQNPHRFPWSPVETRPDSFA